MQEITIRHSEERDVAALAQIHSGPNAYSNTLQLPFPSNEKWKQRLAALPQGKHSLVAEIDEIVVGHLALEVMPNPRRKHAATIGMAVEDRHQGKGVGNRLLGHAIDLAENWLNIHRLELTVFVDNHPAIALYKKHGFEIEGESIGYAFRNGQYVNVYQMAKVRQAHAG